MSDAFIPYGTYWSTPFAKWQGSLAHLHSLKLAAQTARDALAARRVPLDVIDLGILGVTNPQVSSFYGLPWVTGMIGLEGITGPTVQQACATSARALQMAMLEPKFALMDESDSGLDIDALRVVADGINKLATPERGFLLITHYQRLLNYVKPHYVSIFYDGRVVMTGGPEVAHMLEEKGYGWVEREFGAQVEPA